MKTRRILPVLFVCLICISCNKSVNTDLIRYEVTLTGAFSWHGSYFNSNAQVVGISNAPNGWKHEFRNTNGLTVLVLSAYADCITSSCDALMKIYLNNRLVAEGWSSSMPQVMYQY